MNQWQALRQVRKRLRDRTWPSGGSKVFNESAVVTAGPTEEGFPVLPMPFALIRPGSGQADPDHREEPGLWVADFSVILAVAVAGDAVGEHALLGAAREAETKSAGMGLLEVEEQLYGAIRELSANDGLSIESVAESVVQATRALDLGYVAFREYGFRMRVSTSKEFPPPENLVATDAGGGFAALSWVLHPPRFDRYRVRMRRAAGSTPPANIGAGVEVTLLDDLSTGHTDNPGAGTFSYSVFGTYDDRSGPPDTDKDISSPASATVTVT